MQQNQCFQYFLHTPVHFRFSSPREQSKILSEARICPDCSASTSPSKLAFIRSSLFRSRFFELSSRSCTYLLELFASAFAKWFSAIAATLRPVLPGDISPGNYSLPPCARRAMHSCARRVGDASVSVTVLLKSESALQSNSPLQVGMEPFHAPSPPHRILSGPVSTWPHMQAKTALPPTVLLCSNNWSFAFAGSSGGQSIVSQCGIAPDHLPATHSNGSERVRRYAGRDLGQVGDHIRNNNSLYGLPKVNSCVDWLNIHYWFKGPFIWLESIFLSI